MKMKNGTSRKLRYGGVTLALTAAIIAIVILVNVAFSALARKLLWYTDLTPELEFTLSENCITLLKDGDPTFTESTSAIEKIDEFREAARKEHPEWSESEVKKNTAIKIIFCDDELEWTGDNTAMKYVWKTAADLAKEFNGYIDVEFVDTVRNPTAVTKYGAGITDQSVIIDCNGEFRVRTLTNFYIFGTDDSTTPWAYNGEKVLASAIMAVTRSFTPIACITKGHGEVLPGQSFILTLANAGYLFKEIDLTKDEIPEDCRLMIISSPAEDFMVADGISEHDEIGVLDEYLDKSNSLMVLMSPDQTEPLVNLEEYLAEWGIEFERAEDGGTYHPYRVQDLGNSYDKAGFTIDAEYVDYGLGNDITGPISKLGRKIVFPNVMTVDYSDVVTMSGYTEEDGGDVLGDYGLVSADGTYREVYPVFTAHNGALALANGAEVAKADNGNVLELMMVSVEDRMVQEDNYGYSSIDQASYVIATGCPEFLTDTMLHGQYGNNMFLEYTLRTIGHEPVPVGLTFRPFGDTEIDTVTTADATWYTAILTIVPLVLALGCGFFVIIRRKNR